MMKLLIKKKYFDLIKEGKKKFEYRDAHITFICEETKETLKKEVIGSDVIVNAGDYPDVLKDDFIIEFELKK